MKSDREVAPTIASDHVGPERQSAPNTSPVNAAHLATGPPTRILRWPAVHDLIARSRSSVWRDIRAGRFPAPIQLGENAIGWHEHEVIAWVEARPRAAYAT